LNTDPSYRGGEHWFCIYCDLKHKGTEDDPYTIEFFNSSSYPPVASVHDWIDRNRTEICSAGKHVEYIQVIQQSAIQTSNTECGIWSLMYIQSRLEGHPYTYFRDKKATCTDMMRLRKSLFRHTHLR
jgi:hypothetical protein